MNDERHMARAIELAARARGRTHPNPLVGCVIVRDGEVLGEGFHRQAGEDHGEVDALKACVEDPRGADLYVNHEPCCHHGRTPPCTDAILEAGIRRVVVGTIDPDPRVSGRGLEVLREAGVEVIYGILEEESRALNAPFFKYIQQKLPWVAAKWAMSLDGKIATRSGDSRWVTGPEARRRNHQLRDEHDAILVGKATLLRDDPALTCRIEGGRDPLRFVVDARLEAPLTHQVFQADHSPEKTVVLTAVPDGSPSDRDKRAALADRGVEIQEIPTDDRGWLSPRAILEAIHHRERMSVLVEGGGALLGSLFDADLIDYAYAFIAPVLVGGADAPTPLEALGLAAMRERRTIQPPQLEEVGNDWLIHGPCVTAPPEEDS